jgi:hypothetical protein
MVAPAISGAIGGAVIATNPDLVLIPKEVSNSETLNYSARMVYSALTLTVEQNGRRIIDSSPANYTFRVSYPFSFLTNNWGGVITIACIPEGSDTKITILGSGRDPNYRVKKIGDEILTGLRLALEQLPKGSSP